jgi:hypothetical protein
MSTLRGLILGALREPIVAKDANREVGLRRDCATSRRYEPKYRAIARATFSHRHSQTLSHRTDR